MSAFEQSKPWRTIAIAGVGLIGGSFALALRRAGFTGRIIGVSSPRTVKVALDGGVIDDALPLAEAAIIADAVYLSQPIENIIQSLAEVDAAVRPGTLITDAGSTKREICERAAQVVKRGRFVGGHPMAGKEARGVEAAEAGLFEGRPYVLTGEDDILESWIARMGARLVRLDPVAHDKLVAKVSHLPQIVSTALALSLAGAPSASQVAGPAAIDMTRLALSPYEVWRSILATNAGAVEAEITAFIRELEHLRDRISAGADLTADFKVAANTAQRIRVP